MNTALTALTRPHHVTGPHHRERRDRQREMRGQPEGHGRDAEYDHPAEHPAPDLPGDRQQPEDHAADSSPHAWCRTQQAEPAGTHPQDVGRVDGQQRRRATEQHGEQVERDCAQHRSA
jgi:hypothetical protein